MSHIESEPFFVTRIPQWGPVQLALIVLICGAYMLGLLFHQTSQVPAYKTKVRIIETLARGEAQGKQIAGQPPSEFVSKYISYVPAPSQDAFTALYGWAPREAVYHGRFWQPVTYILLHDPGPTAFMHCLTSVAVLVLLGGVVERRYGPLRMIILVLGAAVAGALGTAALWPGGCYVGANALVLAICVIFIFNVTYEDVAVGRFLPQATTIGIVVCLLSVVVAVIYGHAEMPEPRTGLQRIAHLGLLTGALWGFAFFRFEPRLFERWISWRIRRRQRLRDTEADIRERVDQVLEKIQTQGKDSLTRRERIFLRTASKFLRRMQQKDESAS